jgi:hypothetical protein
MKTTPGWPLRNNYSQEFESSGEAFVTMLPAANLRDGDHLSDRYWKSLKRNRHVTRRYCPIEGIRGVGRCL